MRDKPSNLGFARFRFDRRIAVRFLFSFILCWFFVFFGACAPTRYFEISRFDELTFSDKQLDSKYRIDQAQLKKAGEMWLSSNDNLELVYGWSDLTFKARAVGVDTCASYSFESTECLECTPCSSPCGSQLVSAELIEPALATLEKTVGMNNPIVLHTLNVSTGCLRNHPVVMVEDDSTYTLTNKTLAVDKNNSPPKLTLKTRVVGSTTTFDLPITKILDGSQPDNMKLHGSVELIGDIWDDEFSNSLKVTQIEVLPGKKDMDEVFKVTSDPKISVQPSRIVWIADFANTQNYSGQRRCYFDRNNLNGIFNIFDGCRVNPDGEPSPVRTSLTPTHLEETIFASQILTWFVEYDKAHFIGQTPVVEMPKICTATVTRMIDGMPQEFCIGVDIVPILRFTIEQR